MIRIFNLRRYNGSFAYIPAPGNVGTGGPCSGEHEVSQLLQNAEMDSDRSWRKSGYSGPLQNLPSSEWRAMDGAFVLVWLNNVPFAGEHVMSAPNAKVLFCPLCCLTVLLSRLSCWIWCLGRRPFVWKCLPAYHLLLHQWRSIHEYIFILEVRALIDQPTNLSYIVLQFSDGYLDMVVVKDCPRWALLNLLLKIDTGGHIKSKYVEYLKVLSDSIV